MGLIGDWVNSKRIDDPVRGTAVVVAISSPPDHASSFNCSMNLTVSPEGMDPYALEYSCMVSAKKYPWPGRTLPVTVDRHDPSHLRIEWDEVETGDDRGRQAAEQMAAALKARQAGGGGTAGGAGPPVVVGGGQAINVPPGTDPADYVKQMFPGAQGEEMAEKVRQAMAMAAQWQQGGAGTAFPGVGGTMPAIPGAAPAGGGTDPVAQIEKLAKLRDAGILSAEEFEESKKRLLEDL